MDIKVLRYFVTVIEEGTISKAAQTLNMAQPPLSQQIKALESELNMELFVRGSRSITPTEGGRILYKRALKIIDMFENTKHELMSMNSGEIGWLKLGCIDSMENYMMSSWLNTYHKTYENVKFQFYTGDSDEILEFLREHVVELGVVRHPFDTDKFSSILLPDDKLIVVVPDSLSDNPDPVYFHELISYPILVHRRYQYRLSEYYRKNQCKFTPYCISNDTSNLIKWVQNGFGAAIVPFHSCIGIDDPKLHFRIIGDEEMRTKTSIIWEKNVHLSNTALNLLDMIEKDTAGK